VNKTGVQSAMKAVIFDVDGVLLDSRDANIAWYRAFLAGHGYDVSDDRLAFGHTATLRASIAHMTQETDERVDALWDLARALPGYPNELLRLPVGASETLKSLADEYPLAIVTSRIREGVDHFFAFSGLQDLFGVVVTYEDYANPKPAPEPLLLACARLGIQPSRAVYVGDAQTDFECAMAAGAHFIAFGGVVVGAENELSSFAALPEMLRGLRLPC